MIFFKWLFLALLDWLLCCWVFMRPALRRMVANKLCNQREA